MLKRNLKLDRRHLYYFIRKYRVQTEYEDILKTLPLTKFDYPERKIHVPEKSVDVINVWKEEIKHYIDYIKHPSSDKQFLISPLPNCYDTVVIGGGFIGSSLGFWLREQYRHNQSILVIDKNFQPNEMINHEKMKSEEIPAQLSIGNIRQQFSLKENIELAKYSAYFFRNASEILSLTQYFSPPIPYRPFGCLTLAKKDNEEVMKENHILQGSLKVCNEILTPFQINQRFPSLNTTDITLGCHGLQHEGWIDPDNYLLILRSAAMRRGTIFMEAEPVEFVYDKTPWGSFLGYDFEAYKPTNILILKLADGSYKEILFSNCILALGAETGQFAKNLLHLNQNNQGLFGLELPIERRKRYRFCFEAPEGALELSSPLIIDPSGLFVQRVGINDYICGMPPIPEEEPTTENLDVDFDFFHERIWPILAHRIPVLEQLRLKSGYAYYIDVNTFDGNGIVGRIPAYHNIFFAAGFGENELQFSPGVGRALSELLYDNGFTTVDLTKMSFIRVLKNKPLHEGIGLN